MLDQLLHSQLVFWVLYRAAFFAIASCYSYSCYSAIPHNDALLTPQFDGALLDLSSGAHCCFTDARPAHFPQFSKTDFFGLFWTGLDSLKVLQ